MSSTAYPVPAAPIVAPASVAAVEVIVHPVPPATANVCALPIVNDAVSFADLCKLILSEVTSQRPESVLVPIILVL